ncbi:Bro-N domain-containing protein [Treponema sp.]|uniref:BRO-N domain-containing protein n=1 Tax=Treponema sp. TaxID=166 RepID=UPI0025DAC8C5|nr:Bro-N domain-containing protein [Treponema sp.]
MENEKKDLPNKIQIFDNSKIRSVWDSEHEKWYFAIVDVVAVLSESENPQAYWRKLKQRLKEEGNETVTNCHTLKLPAADGKMRQTDVADVPQLLRLIQSIPSKKAEPFKIWLATVGGEFLDEAVDPELSIERAVQNYKNLGYSDNWINQRIKSIEVRKALTDEWDKSGVKKGKEYALLTDLMYRTWADMSAKEYKDFKGLKKENLRDNMTNLELILNMLAEASATELSQKETPSTLNESARIAVSGAEVARDARKSLEKRGGTVISSKNAKEIGTQQLPFEDHQKEDNSF